MRELSRISDDEINKIADKMSDYFLKDIRKNSFSIDFNILEKRLETKYMHDGQRIIVDHGMSEQWSEINCKTEIKIFEKCGMRHTDHIIRKKVYSYLIQPEKKFYKELEKIPDSEWLSMTSVTKTISQDILGLIEKTATSIGFTLEDILQLMAENRFITELRSKKKS